MKTPGFNFRPVDRAIAERVIVDSVPERAAELREIWAKYDLQFAVVSDSLKIGFRSRGKVIEFDNKTMRILWVFAHSAWRMFVCYSPHVLLALATGCSIDLEMMQRDQGLEKARASFEGILYVVRNAVAAQCADDVAWPLDLPDPMADRSSLSVEQKAVFDLAIMATAYGFLHEVQHVMFAKDKNAPPRRPDEEIACDVFARDFLLAKIDSYAKTTSWSADLILMKRAMAIALGAFFVYEATLTEARAGTEDYPPFADRFEALIGQIEAPRDNHFWVFAASLLLATLRRLDPRTPVKADTPDKLCSVLIQAVRTATPDVLIRER